LNPFQFIDIGKLAFIIDEPMIHVESNMFRYGYVLNHYINRY